MVRSRRWTIVVLLLAAMAGSFALGVAADKKKDSPSAAQGWKQGVGWGWIWGDEDQLGALNGLSDATRLAALKTIESGKTYDLGIRYSRASYKWPGHSPGEIMTFRSPEGVKRQQDNPFTAADVNSSGQGWHSCALFISDNVGTQIDGLGHVTVGEDNHWYNGYTEAEWGGDFGVRRCDAAVVGSPGTELEFAL